MAENSKIEWTDHTFNPWIGCTKVSDGCRFCYAENLMDTRYGRANWGKGKPRVQTSPANWKKPLAWNRQAERDGRRYRVFCASLADVFDFEVDDAWRDRLFSLIEATPNLDWLLLTKRPENAKRYLAQRYGGDPFVRGGIPENIWIGTSVEDQKAAASRIPILLEIPAVVRFLSMEPLLGSVDLGPYLEGEARLDWVIVGGESGQHARPSHPEWFLSLRDQCVAAGVAFHFKQWGEWAPGHEHRRVTRGKNTKTIGFNGQGSPLAGRNATMVRVGKKLAGRLLDGRTWDGLPLSDSST